MRRPAGPRAWDPTMIGMARGRVPSAYPVPRQRVPRILGGLKGAAPTSPCADTEWMPATSFESFVRLGSDPSTAEFTTGSGGQGSLGDGSDSTYVTPEVGIDSPWADVYPDSYAAGPLVAIVGFDALPGIASCPLDTIEVKIRYRTAATFVANVEISTEPFSDFTFLQDWRLEASDTSWHEHTFVLPYSGPLTGIPEHDTIRAALAAGTFKVWLYPDLPGDFWAAIDISEVSLRVLVGGPA